MVCFSPSSDCSATLIGRALGDHFPPSLTHHLCKSIHYQIPNSVLIITPAFAHGVHILCLPKSHVSVSIPLSEFSRLRCDFYPTYQLCKKNLLVLLSREKLSSSLLPFLCAFFTLISHFCHIHSTTDSIYVGLFPHTKQFSATPAYCSTSQLNFDTTYPKRAEYSASKEVKATKYTSVHHFRRRHKLRFHLFF